MSYLKTGAYLQSDKISECVGNAHFLTLADDPLKSDVCDRRCCTHVNKAQRVKLFPGYQVPFAAQVRSGADILTGAVGLITEPHQAEKILLKEQADAIFMGREMLRSPYWPMNARHILDSDSTWTSQYLSAAPSQTSPAARR